MDATQLRIILLIAGLVLIAAIYFLGRPSKPDQGRRRDPAPRQVDRSGRRVEPTFAEMLEAEAERATESEDGPGFPDTAEQPELDLIDETLATHRRGGGSQVGARVDERFDRIVTLMVAARAGHMLRGPDLVVAAEKAGLTFGHMSIFHRLVDGHPEAGPVFSMANMLKPGSFDMANIQSVETPGISFFMTLPAPVPALDGWDMMLPTVQRMAELLDGIVLDEDRNALGRQRIAHIRDELRAYDRKQDALNAPPRWQ